MAVLYSEMKDLYKTEVTNFDTPIEFNFKLYKSMIIHDYKRRAIQKDKTYKIEKFSINRLTLKEKRA